MLTIEFCGSHLYKVTNTYSCFNFEKNSKYENCKSYELEKCGWTHQFTDLWMACLTLQLWSEKMYV